ncbi:MAG: type 2 isopentenyl-diphosphate Delta-isomerase [Candidatus Nezhaarchaeales archaeon]|nr:type 2 isopentenyl-diphosphate Delta-isomerase [Candidatus Nezhaarchaeota archaeon]
MSDISDRKLEHIEICIKEDVEMHHNTTGFEDVWLVHRCLPEIDVSDVSLETEFLGFKLKAPIMISAMTGGHPKTKEINSALAEVVEEMGIAMAVGSQRAALIDESLVDTFAVVRKKAPNAYIIANIGVTQLIDHFSLSDVRKIIDMVDANALNIHLNPAHELSQIRGDLKFKGALEAIRKVSESIDVPVIVKEIGCGISREDALRLVKEAHVKAIDVAGAGGTSWCKVEALRAKRRGDYLRARIAEAFAEWGIPTAISVIEVKSEVDVPVIASGGIRSGIDCAKAIAIGADMVGVALPALRAVSRGVDELRSYLSVIAEQLRGAMFLTGSRSIRDLKRAEVVIIGRVREWLQMRGVNIDEYLERRRKV